MDELSADLLAALAGPEEQAYRHEANGWPLDWQLDQVAAHYQIHLWGDSVQVATDRELVLVETLIEAGAFPDSARSDFTRMDPKEQPEREQHDSRRSQRVGGLRRAR
jgi:hypothetical protein